MKKIVLFALAAILYGNAFAAKPAKKADIKLSTEKDSIAYAYGLSLAQQGLTQYIAQLGVIADTASVRKEYGDKIAAAVEPSAKAKLEKELKFKLDSINKANDKNLSRFIEGLQARFEAKEENKSYFEGVSIGNQLQAMIPNFSAQLYGKDKKDEISKDLTLAGLIGALKNEKPLMDNSYDFVEQRMTAAQAKLEQEKDAELKVQYADDIAKAERFFAENKTNPEVVTLPSGLQYKVITAGTGEKPTATDRVKVHYTGTLLDGTKFDSSIDRGEPAVFGVGQVIRGWTEALQLMPVGSKWMLYIPSELGYGSNGAGGTIKPFAPLVFEVELLGIEK
ncbi:MAG: FKBP-type peptidyl-prolyl cis-trans isomerase [Prevotella sp.]|jgi:FKBP-type peptidyl-prolyl cis-trans isomerase FklB|nr:FKBP-type peptidyl-prolyl cis-trans isomerase [Prevotella sp.]